MLLIAGLEIRVEQLKWACLCATWPRLRFLFYFRFLRDFAILDVAPEVCKYGLKQPLKKHSCVLFPVRVFLTKGTSILT